MDSLSSACALMRGSIDALVGLESGAVCEEMEAVGNLTSIYYVDTQGSEVILDAFGRLLFTVSRPSV